MSGAAIAAGAVVRQGYLRKLKTMKRKYFVLRGETADCSPRLEYYESEKKFRTGATPRRVIPLKSCFNIARRLDLKQRHVIALYTKEEQFCVCAEGEEDLQAWLTDILREHQSNDSIEELLHPTQHVWHVNVQKKGLGASKNIIGPYNLCLTDKTLTLVKIRRDAALADQLLNDGVEFSLRNIRRCGDSECFFYMEVGRQTATGAGELWMHTEDANIAQSMHNTIYHAMCNCKSEKELQPVTRTRSASANEDPRKSTLTSRRLTISDGTSRAGLASLDKSCCVGSYIKQCVCATTYSIDESAAAIAPLTAKNAGIDNQQNNPLIPTDTKPEGKENTGRPMHHRTASLPTGYPIFHEPLKIVHERTRSAPLTGDEVDRLTIEKAARHASCKAFNGSDIFLSKKTSQWSRRASTGTRLSKLSPAHIKNAPVTRNRCDSMPSRTCPPIDAERTPQRTQGAQDAGDVSRDETDASPADWHKTPRIPEEPDYCEMSSIEIMNMFMSNVGGTLGAESPCGDTPDGYLPMAPSDTQPALSASSGSVCSGTPSTDPRFSGYQLEPATAHIADEEESMRHPRAYSVGSRPAPSRPAQDTARMRAYSVGARTRTRPAHPPPLHAAPAKNSNSAPLLPRASADDLMELDFSNNSPKTKVIVASTPPSSGFVAPRLSSSRNFKPKVDEYVDMSPRASGYVEMKPSEGIISSTPIPLGKSPPVRTSLSKSPPGPVATTPDGYVEMNYGKRPDSDRTPSRPITIVADRLRLDNTPSTPIQTPQTPAEEILGRRKRNGRHSKDPITPLGSQTIFPLSLDSPASPLRPDDNRHDLEAHDVFEEETLHHPLTTVREISEECGRRSPEVGSPPHYVTLARTVSQPIAAPPKNSESDGDELSCNPTATKTWAGDPSSVIKPPPNRFSGGDERKSSSPAPNENSTLNYAALDLEPRNTATATAPRAYTQIDFARSEKLHTADAN